MPVGLTGPILNAESNEAILSMEETEVVFMKTFVLGDNKKVLSSSFLSLVIMLEALVFI